MAEVTRTLNDEPGNLGSLNLVYNKQVQIAANQDYWTPGLTDVAFFGTSNPAAVTKIVVDSTVKPVRITFTTAGAVADLAVWAAGWP